MTGRRLPRVSDFPRTPVKGRTLELTGDETLLIYFGLRALVDEGKLAPGEYELIVQLRHKIREAGY